MTSDPLTLPPKNRKTKRTGHNATTTMIPLHPQTVDKHARGGEPRAPCRGAALAPRFANTDGRRASYAGSFVDILVLTTTLKASNFHTLP